MNLSTKPPKIYSKTRNKKAKITYYSKLLHKYNAYPKHIWQVMKEITGKQKTKSNLLPQEIKVDKTIIENPQHIAKEFNKIFYFCWANIGEKSPEH